MANPKTLAVQIMDREYRVNCPEGSEHSLLQAASHLDGKMREIKAASSASGKVLSADRVAVIAALNITHQLLGGERNKTDERQALVTLHEALDAALQQDLQLEL